MTQIKNPIPTLGRIVHYTYADGVTRAAIIVNVHDAESGLVNLQVFLDGTNDLGLYDHQRNAYTSPKDGWKTSVLPAEEPTPERWNWPARGILPAPFVPEEPTQVPAFDVLTTKVAEKEAEAAREVVEVSADEAPELAEILRSGFPAPEAEKAKEPEDGSAGT